jgi:8-oxo-dGTP pyrophosphatase MutT (NUDIX family)
MNPFEQTLRRLEARLTPLANLRVAIDRVPQAAVTIILREAREGVELLIIKRAEREGDPWSGHLALPGGRADATDRNLLATAARETQEEIGVNLLDGGRFLGRLPLVDTRNARLPDLEITPFVALAPPDFSVRLNGEVHSTFWVSIDALKRDGASIEYRFQHGDLILKRPAYPSEGGPIWGITERIITSFLSHLD